MSFITAMRQLSNFVPSYIHICIVRGTRYRHNSTTGILKTMDESKLAYLEHLKTVAANAIDSAADKLNHVSQEIWLNPELHYQEHKAHHLLTDFLEASGFVVQRKHCLETAFRATYKKDEGKGPNVAVLCEYDALPGIGHGCGHNLIAEVGIGAGLGIKAAMEVSSHPLGQLTVLGTPAEEDGGGKIDLIEAGAFKDVDLAMMAHPANFAAAHLTSLGSLEVEITYTGKASHAACQPWEGVNALDAAVMAYSSISCLRQQMHESCRVHGIITKGGVAPNIIPSEAQLAYYIRATSQRELKALVRKVDACFDAAALATGCEVRKNWQPRSCSAVISNHTLLEVYEKNALSIGINFTRDRKILGQSSGSTDMGNVSHIIPSIHPYFDIKGPHKEHTPGFATQAGSQEAQPGTLLQAKALAFTALEMMFRPELIEEMKVSFKKDLQDAADD